MSAYSGDPERYSHLKTIYIETDLGMSGFIIEEVQPKGRYSLVKLRNVDSKEAARKLVQKEVWLPEEMKVELPADTYFFHDLIGLKVFDTSEQYLGIVEEVLHNSGNDVYLIRQDEKEILVPAVKQFIKRIDLIDRKMVVELIEGMIS